MLTMNMIRRDVSRSRGSTAVVLIFVTLASLLMASGTGLIARLTGSVDALFGAAVTPDIVQMHAGAIDELSIRAWARTRPEVAAVQTSELISLDRRLLELGGTGRSEADGVMDIGLTVQNASMDLLLDLENRPVAPEPGTVGVPVFYVLRDGLVRGDPVRIAGRNFTISDVLRDSQMNPAIVHSKRLVLHPDDFALIRAMIPETEWLISFRLHDPSTADRVVAAYQATSLPQNGPMVTRDVFRLLNALSNGVVALVVILTSMVLVGIALLCLRLTILAGLENDVREIGIMRAIGFRATQIRRIYVLKYCVIAGLGTILGFLLSLPLVELLTRDLTFMAGPPPPSVLRSLVTLAGSGLVFALAVTSSLLVLRRLNRMGALDALHAEHRAESGRLARLVPLRRLPSGDPHRWLGVRRVLEQPRFFTLMLVVFMGATAVITVPMHVLHTMESPDFIRYLGIARSDIRVDLGNGSGRGETADIESVLSASPAVAAFRVTATSLIPLHGPDGESDMTIAEHGDIVAMDLDFIDGGPPNRDDEIAVSYLLARDRRLAPGTVLTGPMNEALAVVGIYQDVTNGGRTVRLARPALPERVIRRVVSVDLVSTASAEERDAIRAALQTAAPQARITRVDDYLRQTLGATIAGLQMVLLAAGAAALAVAVLVTALFMQLLLRRDRHRLMTFHRLGTPRADLRRQYTSGALLVVIVGVALGLFVSATMGERLASGLWSMMGAARISFVIAPFTTFFAIPAAFAGLVVITTRLSFGSAVKATGGTR